jgi:tetratricopeptide (TPR) repeat protein
MAGVNLVACHFFIYDRGYMFRPGCRNPLIIAVLLTSGLCAAQSAPKAASPDSTTAVQKAASLAEAGHCSEALSGLKKGLHQTESKDLKRRVGLDGIRCAMTMNEADAALDFLGVMTRDFPHDPEVLYVAVHAYSDLSTRASQELAENAPSSYQAHELLAESYESQGKWEEAEKEYRAILARNPELPGIHFRLGRLLLSVPNPSPDAAEEAKRDFEQELKIDPSNAGAEYVLGELARQNQQWEEAVAHFSRAAKLDSRFSEAYLGLGVTLIAEKRYPDAIPPLETAVRLDPQNPDAHYNLATAYTRAGRKQDGEKEFAIHQHLIGAQPGGRPSPQEEKK